MDIETLKKEHPQLATALQEEGRKQGAEEERARIKAVEAQTMPGHEKLIAALKFDGKTTGPEAAVQVLNAERTKRAATLGDLEADARGARVHAAKAPEPGEEDDNDNDEDGEECDEDENASASPSGGKPKKKALRNMKDAVATANVARQYIAEQAKLGRRVSAAEAVTAVIRGA